MTEEHILQASVILAMVWIWGHVYEIALELKNQELRSRLGL